MEITFGTAGWNGVMNMEWKIMNEMGWNGARILISFFSLRKNEME